MHCYMYEKVKECVVYLLTASTRNRGTRAHLLGIKERAFYVSSRSMRLWHMKTTCIFMLMISIITHHSIAASAALEQLLLLNYNYYDTIWVTR